jgi:geranylgeranyl reductase family protein
MNTTRVVVIGAGPAGSAAAMSLARCSHTEVQLLDRAVFPRRKVCGSGLSPWALRLLDDMGLGGAVRKDAYPIRAALIGGAEGAVVQLRSKYQAAVLLRSRFDTLLAHEAARRGADLREGVGVHGVVRDRGRLVGLKTTQGDIAADAVIVCNGANTTLGKSPRPGQTLHSILGWYEGVEGIGEAVELYFDATVTPFYGWVFPESPRRVNIGICFEPTAGGPNARQRFEMFVERRLAKRMRHAQPLDRLVGHPIATTAQPTALVQQGMLIAGEAGRLVDPATAEGIHHALASGLLAGRFLGSLLERGDEPSERHLRPYTALVRRRIGRRLHIGQYVLQGTRAGLLDLALRFGSLRPVQSALAWLLAGA